MAKSYTTYFDTSAPAASKNGDTISIPADKKKVVAIGLPAEGRVTRLVVVQASGTGAAFTVDLLESKVPFDVGEYAVAASPADDINLYRVIAQLSAIAGAAAVFRADQGQAYRNTDKGATDAERKLYLLITPTSSEITTWKVVINIWSEVGN